MLGGVVGLLGYGTFVKDGDVSWKLPAAATVWFWGFSIYTISQEGILALLQNQNQNYWGNQIFFDLLYSICLFWFSMLPRAKALGMPVLPWFLYVCGTASVGGLHMFARILYLEENKPSEELPEPREGGDKYYSSINKN
eukprot:scaffold2212_cov143-Cylindrotheca_fusiformis.AAC.15